jgi:hypothetical protein
MHIMKVAIRPSRFYTNNDIMNRIREIGTGLEIEWDMDHENITLGTKGDEKAVWPLFSYLRFEYAALIPWGGVLDTRVGVIYSAISGGNWTGRQYSDISWVFRDLCGVPTKKDIKMKSYRFDRIDYYEGNLSMQYAGVLSISKYRPGGSIKADTNFDTDVFYSLSAMLPIVIEDTERPVTLRNVRIYGGEMVYWGPEEGDREDNVVTLR